MFSFIYPLFISSVIHPFCIRCKVPYSKVRDRSSLKKAKKAQNWFFEQYVFPTTEDGNLNILAFAEEDMLKVLVRTKARCFADILMEAYHLKDGATTSAEFVFGLTGGNREKYNGTYGADLSKMFLISIGADYSEFDLRSQLQNGLVVVDARSTKRLLHDVFFPELQRHLSDLLMGENTEICKVYVRFCPQTCGCDTQMDPLDNGELLHQQHRFKEVIRRQDSRTEGRTQRRKGGLVEGRTI
jgi:hypothetical protein